jgi:hypothetical protein
MFGMLDYRAYKLLWLIYLPFRLIFVIATFGSMAIAIIIGSSLNYSLLVRIIIACAIFWGINLAILGVRLILNWFITKSFFWVIDVIPAKGDSVAEAKKIVLEGPAIWIDKKFKTDIGNWTEDDTEQNISLANWREKLFFNAAGRAREAIQRYQQLYKATGKQPGDLTEEEIQKVLCDLRFSWLQGLIIRGGSFYGTIFVVIIAIAIISLDNSVR